MSEPLDLGAVLALAASATPGPWKVWAMQVCADPVGNSNLDDALLIANTIDPDRGLRTFNAEFIAAARSLVPQLCAEITALRAEVAEADYVSRVTGDKLVMVKEERDCLRAELGSYGPPETEWAMRYAKTGQRPGILECRDEIAAIAHAESMQLSKMDVAVVSRLVRRGPWVTNEKPNADIRDDASEGDTL